MEPDFITITFLVVFVSLVTGLLCTAVGYHFGFNEAFSRGIDVGYLIGRSEVKDDCQY